jgi:hypothetical protein
MARERSCSIATASHFTGPLLDGLTARAHQKVAIVALANKLVRVAWAVLHNREPYRRPDLVASGAAT